MMLKSLKGLFGKPNGNKVFIKTTSKPIEINPGSAKSLARHVGRLANLMNVAANGDRRKDVSDEIKQRQAAIEAYGHDAPKDEHEARQLLHKLGAI